MKEKQACAQHTVCRDKTSGKPSGGDLKKLTVRMQTM